MVKTSPTVQQARKLLEDRLAELKPFVREYADLLEMEKALPPKRIGRPPKT